MVPPTVVVSNSASWSNALRRLPRFRIEQLEHPFPEVALDERVHYAIWVEDTLADERPELPLDEQGRQATLFGDTVLGVTNVSARVHPPASGHGPLQPVFRLR